MKKKKKNTKILNCENCKINMKSVINIWKMLLKMIIK